MSFTAIIVGDQSLTVECARRLLARGHILKAIVSDARRVTEWAEHNGIAVIAPGSALVDRLDGYQGDWLLNIAGLRILPQQVLAKARLGCVNFHDGPLPRYAGLNAPVWALLNGEPRHGICWHHIVEGIDLGAVLVREDFDITPDDTALTLNAKCFGAALDSFELLLDRIEAGDTTGSPQDLTQRTVFARDDRPALAGHLDFTKPAIDLERLVRALDHGPYWNPLTTAKIDLDGAVACIGRAEIVPGLGQPGQVLSVDHDSIVVACGGGALCLRGLVCQQGFPIDPMYHVSGGAILPSPDAALTDALAHIVRGESAWAQALRGMVPAALPMASTSAERATLPLATLSGSIPEQIATFGRALAPLLGSSQFDLAYRDGAIAQAQARAPLHLSPWVPVQVDLTASDLDAHLTTRLTLATRAPGFARDLALRDPALGPIMMPAIAVTHGNDWMQAALTLDLSGHVLIYDPAALTADQVAGIATRMATPMLTHDTTLPYNRICMHRAFEAQVRATPDAPALSFRHQTLTYAELNARANRVAHLLVQMGVGPDMPVALCVDRGPNLLIGALGILKAGGAYVPLDPGYPAERLAHYLSDSGAPVIVTERAQFDRLPAHAAQVLALDTDIRLTTQPALNPETAVTPDHLAYLIYTSGSTGKPKGVMVEHGNVANFFAGMDQHIAHDKGGVWLAVTSLNFDISVLELFWTLARGFKIVLVADEDRLAPASAPIRVSGTGMDFSLMYWGNDDGEGAQKYRLLLEGAKFADTHGFCAVWTPERHFHAFGGPFPNPSVSGAAVAAVTQNIAVRAGSCVVPLHHPIRIAEEWAMIDNLTNGRTGIGIASGWHPVDFVIRPENRPPHNKRAMLETIDTLRKLWRGDVVEFDKGDGVVPIQTLPRPVSKELNIWLTTAGNPETWRDAGNLGAHVLTHLLGQSIDEVAEKIAIYHQALRESGRDPAKYTVTLMLHTFVARDREHARDVACGPMKSYLKAAAALVKQYAWAFPAFKRPAGAANPMDIDLSTLTEDEVDGILDYAFNRYFEDSGLFGTVDDCLARVEKLKGIGVTEVACLIDYGIASETVLEGLYPLAEVVKRANAGAELRDDDFSIPAQIARHKVTHLQCTPSMARMLTGDDAARQALARVPNILLGGEALPGPLARDISALTGQPVLNMYGPTETTIWSTVQPTRGETGTVGIGAPIANTQVYVVTPDMNLAAPGQEGELLIGGDGVTRGYWNRADLTTERFVPNPFGAGRLYRTGDLVRRTGEGIAFLGRIDHQVKIRGHRIELGEIEAVLSAQPGVTAAVVTAREDVPGDVRLVAYFTGTPLGDLRAALAARLPAQMVPVHFVPLAQMPLTPNAKIDRKALPAPSQNVAQPTAQVAPPQPAPVIGIIGGTQDHIAAVWASVLGVAEVKPQDNFFNLGGHSLLAVQAHRALRERLSLPGLSITDLFRFPVLADLARHLDAKLGPVAAPAPKPTPPAATRAAATDRMDAMARRRAMRADRNTQ
ncbi:MAG: MupA/Atu3671 family FMN-dependent luciferase-like monooxygenase [Roseinatronobacter sp.]